MISDIKNNRGGFWVRATVQFAIAQNSYLRKCEVRPQDLSSYNFKRSYFWVDFEKVPSK